MAETTRRMAISPSVAGSGAARLQINGEVVVVLKDFFVPRWKHSKQEVRCRVAEQTDDHAILTRLARDDRDAKVRIAAVRRLTDVPLLDEIASSDPDVSIRSLAARKNTLRRVIDAIITRTQRLYALPIHSYTSINEENAHDTVVDKRSATRGVHVQGDLYLFESGAIARANLSRGRFETWYSYAPTPVSEIRACDVTKFLNPLIEAFGCKLTDTALLNDIVNDTELSVRARVEAIRSPSYTDKAVLRQLTLEAKQKDLSAGAERKLIELLRAERV